MEQKTETLLAESNKRVTELEKQCIREQERYSNMADQIREIRAELKKLDEIIRVMERKWAALLTIGSVVQMIAIPLIIKLITK